MLYKCKVKFFNIFFIVKNNACSGVKYLLDVFNKFCLLLNHCCIGLRPCFIFYFKVYIKFYLYIVNLIKLFFSYWLSGKYYKYVYNSCKSNYFLELFITFILSVLIFYFLYFSILYIYSREVYNFSGSFCDFVVQVTSNQWFWSYKIIYNLKDINCEYVYNYDNFEFNAAYFFDIDNISFSYGGEVYYCVSEFEEVFCNCDYFGCGCYPENKFYDMSVLSILDSEVFSRKYPDYGAAGIFLNLYGYDFVIFPIENGEIYYIDEPWLGDEDIDIVY